MRRSGENAMNLGRAFQKIHVEFDASAKSLWVYFASDGVPSYTVAVLEDLHALCAIVKQRFQAAAIQGAPAPVRFFILASRMPGVFNMGGDLGLIATLSRSRDRNALEHYARLTADIVHIMWSGINLPMVTISAVDGNAFGGGFEAALSTQFMVAAPTAKFAFPEVRFGLFPGMGATSLLGRRTTKAFAERMIVDGNTISGTEAFAAGICDRLPNRGTAVDLVRRLTRRWSSDDRFAAVLRLAASRQAAARYERAEARAVVAVWVDAVLGLDERRIKHIDKIVGAQRLMGARLAEAQA
jgi:DSF synthase